MTRTIGRDIAKEYIQLSEGATKDKLIDLSAEAMRKIEELIFHETDLVKTAKSRNQAVKGYQEYVNKEHPNADADDPHYDSEKYYDNPSQRKNSKSYVHCLRYHVKLSLEDSWLSADEKRKKYLEDHHQSNSDFINFVHSQKAGDLPEVNYPKSILERWKLEPKELDNIKGTINHLGISEDEFLKRASCAFAAYVMGGVKRKDVDLSKIETQILLDDFKYKTHPKRTHELTKRALQAIIYYNSTKATEKTQKWAITASAIKQLIGGRDKAIAEAMKFHKTQIDDHNRMNELEALHHNRKKDKSKITDFIDVAAICPTGE